MFSFATDSNDSFTVKNDDGVDFEVKTYQKSQFTGYSGIQGLTKERGERTIGGGKEG